MAQDLQARWGQPITGIVSLATFTMIGWAIWFVFSDPRGPVHSFPYPFVLYLAMMILVGLWQHMLLGDWPFQNMSQPARGVVQTVENLALVWFVIHVVFYRILGLGFNFLSQSNLEALAAAGGGKIVAAGKELTMLQLTAGSGRFAERAIVCFVLIGFFSYPFVTILFEKWPIRPSDLPQPRAGLAEIGWCSMLTLFFYTVLIVPFWGWFYGHAFGDSFGFNVPWWTRWVGTNHVHWVFGWWEWMIIVLFMTPNVWRMKPWSLIKLPQPWKGLVSFILNVILAYVLATICTRIAPLWLPNEVIEGLKKAKPNDAEFIRFQWYHAAEIAGFTLIPLLAWHHYFDDIVPMSNKDSWGAFWFRTIGVLALCAINYSLFYLVGWGHWGLGNPHWEHKFVMGESLIWNFWWIIPLLWNEWFFHKWPFYIHQEQASSKSAPSAKAVKAFGS
jgi:AAT family amino acid transporter